MTIAKGKLVTGLAFATALAAMLVTLTLSEAGAAGQPWTTSNDRAKLTRLWAVGDLGEGALGQSSADLVASRPMEYLLYLGDVYPSGTASDFADNYDPTFGQFSAKTVPAIGNHEHPNRASGFDPYWTAQRGSPPPPYFSFAASGWQFIVLNSEISTGVGSAQHTWLKNLLANSRSRGNCRIALSHRPRYSDGSHGDQSEMEPLWGLLANRARMWISGHDHNMQRLASNRGIVQFVSGAGGRSHYPLDEPSVTPLKFGNTSADGALRLAVKRWPGRGSRADWSFVSADDGTELDTGYLGCKRRR
jgi:hypothetical protein